MNQIPNIEKTMRRGIKLIAGRIEALHPQYFLDETTYKHDVKGTMDVVKGVMADIEETHHHQLQKARQTWLREEIVKLEGMLSRWVAAYMPADEGKDPSKWGFKTEKEAWDFIEKRLTPCPLDPRDKSGEPCDSCIAEWMVYQIPEVDQALQTIIDRYQSELDQDTELLNSVKEDWDKQAKNAMNGLDQDVSK